MKNKVLSATQFQQIDRYTIENDNIPSIDLMERASLQFVHAIVPFVHGKPNIHVFCGSGNNGGDGFAVARMLKEKGCLVNAYLLKTGEGMSPDCMVNSQRFSNFEIIAHEDDFPKIKPDDVVIDALLGTGLARPADGLLRLLIDYLNSCSAKILSIDLPSGLSADEIPSADSSIVKAFFTGTFERPKLAFFLNESAPYVGTWQVLPIGLNAQFMNQQEGDYLYLTDDFLSSLVRPRNKFSHKGTYGHGLLIAGSKGKMGAAILASKSALRSGIGLLTVHVPECGNAIIQTTVPEAMCLSDENHNHVTRLMTDLNLFSAIGIGPGLGTAEGTMNVLEQVLDSNRPIVLDADALNILAVNPDLLGQLPENAILTPHPKEFEHLAGKSANSFERLKLQQNFAQKHHCIVVLKDAITSIAFPDGKIYFNTTGNPGMATGGTGDVLTGIITGLLAQGYAPEDASLMAVYYHGKAGDTAALQVGENQLIASDLIQYFRLPS